MTLPNLLRRLAASESGRLLFVGCGISALLGVMWLGGRVPWVEHAFIILVGCLLFAALLSSYIREWRAAPKQLPRLKLILSRPLLTALTVVQVMLVLLWLFLTWRDGMRPGPSLLMRNALTPSVLAITAWRLAILRRNEKRGHASP